MVCRPCDNSRRQRLSFLSRQTQNGQALIYGIFVMLGSLTGLFFLFNTGQLSSEKTKLVNTADAVAYSAAVVHARALNFDAYNNRALVANEVLVAQMVSLSSWGQYAKSHAESVPVMFPECAASDGSGAAIDAMVKFNYKYALMCYLTAQYASTAIAEIASEIPIVTQKIVDAVELNKTAIKAAQDYLHNQSRFETMRGNVMQEVAKANYVTDGLITVEPLGNATAAPGLQMTDDWKTSTAKYDGKDRTRIGEVAKLAAYSDEFVRDRRWDAKAIAPSLAGIQCIIPPHFNSVKRRGGTELVELDEWQAEDTESYWEWRQEKSGLFGLFTSCKEREYPLGWGEQRAYPDGQDQPANNAKLGDSPTTNPGAHSKASSAQWTNYSGLPSFYDLSPEWLDKPDPRMKFAVRVVRAKADVRTSDGASQIRPSERINKFDGNFASGTMAAIATGEVYFARPWFNKGDYTYTTGDTTYIVTRNQYAVKHGISNTREIGSLFNPYWQVRLVTNDDDKDVHPQQQKQGTVLP